MPYGTHPSAGAVYIKKTGGDVAGGMTIGTELYMFAQSVVPSNPRNNSYQSGVNATTNPSTIVKGVASPSISITSCHKPSWGLPALFTSMLGVGSLLQSDVFRIAVKDDRGLNDGVYSGFRVSEFCKCNNIRMSQSSPNSHITVTMNFLSRFGDSECPYGTTDSVTGEVYPSVPTFPNLYTDSGILTSPCNIDFGNVAQGQSLSDVYAWDLSITRMQSYETTFGQCYPTEITSGMLAGSLTVQQNPRANYTLPYSGNPIIRLNIGTNLTSGTGRFYISGKFVVDDRPMPHTSSKGILTTNASLIDYVNGGSPLSFLAY